MHRVVRLVVSVAVGAALMAVAPASAGLGPSLTVSPNSALAAGQLVQIVGTGVPGTPASAVGACDAATDLTSLATAQPTCELVAVLFGDDSVDISWAAQRILDTPSGSIDCLTTPCIIAYGGQEVDGTPVFVESVPISFAPAPLVTFSPSTPVGDGDSVTVTVGGTAAGDTVEIVQCVNEGPLSVDTPPGPCHEYGGADSVGGGHAATVSIERWVPGSDGIVDCAQSPGCELGVRIRTNGVESYVFGAIAFSAAPRPTMNSAHGPLEFIVFETVHVRDEVQVDITNIDRLGNGVAVQVCVGNLDIGPDLDSCGDVGLAPIVGQSSFTGTFSIPGEFVGADGGTYDCTDPPVFSACFAVLLGHRDPGPSDPFVLSVVGALLDVRARSFLATPTTGLLDGDSVSMTASVGPHGSGGTAVPVQCGFLLPVSYASLRCVAGSDVASDFDGDYSGAITVHRQFAVGDDLVDCVEVPCAVLLAVLDSSGVPVAVPGAPISFTRPS